MDQPQCQPLTWIPLAKLIVSRQKAEQFCVQTRKQMRFISYGRYVQHFQRSATSAAAHHWHAGLVRLPPYGASSFVLQQGESTPSCSFTFQSSRRRKEAPSWLAGWRLCLGHGHSASLLTLPSLLTYPSQRWKGKVAVDVTTLGTTLSLGDAHDEHRLSAAKPEPHARTLLKKFPSPSHRFSAAPCQRQRESKPSGLLQYK